MHAICHNITHHLLISVGKFYPIEKKNIYRSQLEMINHPKKEFAHTHMTLFKENMWTASEEQEGKYFSSAILWSSLFTCSFLFYFSFRSSKIVKSCTLTFYNSIRFIPNTDNCKSYKTVDFMRQGYAKFHFKLGDIFKSSSP